MPRSRYERDDGGGYRGARVTAKPTAACGGARWGGGYRNAAVPLAVSWPLKPTGSLFEMKFCQCVFIFIRRVSHQNARLIVRDELTYPFV
jgi:hypothetical protein